MREEDGIARLVISEEGRIVYANTYFKHLAHLSESSVQAKANNIIRFEDDIQINDVRSGGTPFSYVKTPSRSAFILTGSICRVARVI